MPEHLQPVISMEVLVLGDRGYPLSPTIKPSQVHVAGLTPLLAACQVKTPDLSYDDLVKAVVVTGIRVIQEELAEGLRVERGVSYHGIALNVSVALADFELIDPCGMPGLVSTSIDAERLGPDGPLPTPSTASVERAARVFAPAFAEAIDARVDWPEA